MDYELSVVVPTFNEAGSVGPLVGRLETALAGISWEVLFVDDDSPDGTALRVAEIGSAKPHVRSSSGSGAGAFPRPVWKASPPPVRRLSPSWTPTCSMMNPCCRGCWRC